MPYTHAELGRLPLLGVALASIPLVLVTAALWTGRREKTSFGLANSLVLWVLVSLAPVWSMFYVSPNLEGSRYVYLAAVAWSIHVAMLSLEVAPRRWRRPASVGLIALLLISASGVRLHLAAWREAARLRDAVRVSAAEARRSRDCATAVFTNLPDSVGGAFVFRNGFAEALAMSPAPLSRGARSAAGEPCSFRWDSARSRFVW